MNFKSTKLKNLFNLYHKIPIAARAGIWFIACTILQKGINFISVPIFTRLMPTEEYGLYSTYLSWYSILVIFCTLNIYSTIFVNNYVKAKTDQEKSEVPIPLLSLSGCITLLIFLFYLLFHDHLDSLIGLPFPLTCLLFAQVLFEPVIDIWSEQQRFEYKYVAVVIRTLLTVSLNVILGIFFVWIADHNQAIARACSIVLVKCIFAIALYIYFIRNARMFFSTKGWKHALRVQLPLLPHSLSLTILSSSDRIMISRMVSATAAGIYSVAYSAGFVVNILKNSIIDALKPWMYKNIKERNYNSINKTVNLLMVMVALISFTFTAFGPELISIMAPEQYSSAIYVIPPVAASSYFTFLYNLFSIIGLYYERTNQIMWASIGAAVLNVFLNVLAINLFGYIAAAYTTLICYIFLAIAHYFIMKKICRAYLNNVTIYDIKFIVVMSVIMLLSVLLFVFTYQNIVIRYLIIGLLFFAIYFNRKKFIRLLKELKQTKK